MPNKLYRKGNNNCLMMAATAASSNSTIHSCTMLLSALVVAVNPAILYIGVTIYDLKQKDQK